MSDNEPKPQHDELLKLSGKLAHEIRSQLFCLEINAKSLQIYVPDLLATYKQAEAAGLKLPIIPDSHLDVLQSAAPEICTQLRELNEKLEDFYKLIRSVKKHPRDDLDKLHNTDSLSLKPQSSLRILLVEDEEIHRDIAQNVLISANYNCDIACDGSDALEKFTGNDYDLVLMDLHMPKMDGMRAASQIRKMECNGQHTPIIGLSNIEPLDSHAFFNAGFNKFLLKPLKLDVFEQTLLQLHPHWEA